MPVPTATLILIFFVSYLPSAPHLGRPANEQDIPEEVSGSDEQLNGSTEETRGVLLTHMMSNSWKTQLKQKQTRRHMHVDTQSRCGTARPFGTQRADVRWSAHSSGRRGLIITCREVLLFSEPQPPVCFVISPLLLRVASRVRVSPRPFDWSAGFVFKNDIQKCLTVVFSVLRLMVSTTDVL